jgi:glycolate oxidase FAD binding subunit
MQATCTVTQEQIAAQLAALVGVEHVRVAAGSVHVAPANLDEIAGTMRFSSSNRLAVISVCGGSKLSWGNPVQADVHLSLNRMNAVREHAWQDMTCTVEAGCTWNQLRAKLAIHNQMVAVDVLWPERASVGGTIAVNDSGAFRLKYGGLRDSIIGMTLVLADGTIAKTGGKVVKNVAGYDLHKLMIGSYGTLAVIADVNFRLHPIEQHAQTWTASATEAASFAELLRALLDSQLTPSSIQIRSSGEKAHLDIRIATLPECMADCGEHIQGIFGELRVESSESEVWQARQQLFELPDALVLKVSVLPSRVATFCSELQRRAMTEKLEVESVAQATGLITVALRGPYPHLMELLQQIRDQVGGGGSVVALQVPDSLRHEVDVWSPAPGALALMREIKLRFDPHRVLNPGRFVGGI